MAASLSFRTSTHCGFFTQIVKQFSILNCRGILGRSISGSSRAPCRPPEGVSPSAEPDRDDRDPFPLFSDTCVQDILTNITGFDALKIAGPHKKRLQKPKYKLLTDTELRRETTKAREKLKERLQIPPYMKARKTNRVPLCVDQDLAQFDTSCYVFTDVTFGLKDRDRTVVIREIDGTLREAPWDVKDRMNQIYNPREGKEYLKPSMFNEQHMERLLSEKKYVYILDRACCQFEPDDPEFIRVSHRVLNAVDSSGDHHELRSTRHFGFLAFYLVWYKMADALLLDMLNRDLSSDARDLVRLYSMLHPESELSLSLSQLATDADTTAYVKAYIEGVSSKHSSELELALQAMTDVNTKKGKKM